MMLVASPRPGSIELHFSLKVTGPPPGTPRRYRKEDAETLLAKLADGAGIATFLLGLVFGYQGIVELEHREEAARAAPGRTQTSSMDARGLILTPEEVEELRPAYLALTETAATCGAIAIEIQCPGEPAVPLFALDDEIAQLIRTAPGLDGPAIPLRIRRLEEPEPVNINGATMAGFPATLVDDKRDAFIIWPAGVRLPPIRKTVQVLVLDANLAQNSALLGEFKKSYRYVYAAVQITNN